MLKRVWKLVKIGLAVALVVLALAAAFGYFWVRSQLAPQEVVAGSIRARLVEELGPARARLAERQLGSLVSVVAETAAR